MRTDLLPSNMTTAREAHVRAVLAAYRRGAVMLAAEQWRLLFETGRLNRNHGKDRTSFAEIIGAANRDQMCRHQVVGQLGSWISNRGERVSGCRDEKHAQSRYEAHAPRHQHARGVALASRVRDERHGRNRARSRPPPGTVNHAAGNIGSHRALPIGSVFRSKASILSELVRQFRERRAPGIRSGERGSTAAPRSHNPSFGGETRSRYQICWPLRYLDSSHTGYIPQLLS